MLSIIFESPESLISLAQIPLSLKKSVPFSFNLPDLGFPKLKNLILTLSDMISMDINKSTLSFSLNPTSQACFGAEKEKLQLLLSDYLRMVVEILTRIIRYFNLLIVDDLYNELNTKLGFEFEFRLYNAPDFCHFLYYYCRDILSVQFASGAFMAYSVQPAPPSIKVNPETSTPNFCNSFEASNDKPFSCKLPDYFYSWTDDRKEEEVPEDTPEEAYLIENIKLVEDLLNVRM